MTEKRRINSPKIRNSHPNWGGSSDGWEIVIAGDLSDKQTDLEELLCEVSRGSRGTFYFDSPGGSVFTGLALATLVRIRKLTVTGIVAGECSSAAIMPFAACSERYVTPHSSLLFHPMSWSSEENIRVEEAEEWTRHYKQTEKDLTDLLGRLFGCDMEKLEPWLKPGRYVTGQEMVDAGLAQMLNPFE